MKIGVFCLVDPFCAMEHQLRRIKEMGFDCADVTDTHNGASMGANAGFVASVSLDSNPFDVKRMFDKYGLEISTVCMHGVLIDPVSPERYGTHEMMKAIRMAAAIGVKYCVTTDQDPKLEWTEKLSYENKVYSVAEKLYEPIRLAADYGVEVLLEPHGPLTDTVQGMKDIMKMLDDSPVLGVNMDTGNSWLGGTDPVEMAKALKDKIHHIHWKDLGEEWIPKRGKQFGCGFSTIAVGDGVIDIAGVVDVLKDCNITHSTLEVVGTEEILKKSVAFLRNHGM
jgi:inosose dehydratase